MDITINRTATVLSVRFIHRLKMGKERLIMEQYISKDALVAEIEKRLKFQQTCIKTAHRLTGKAEEEIILEYNQLLSFLDTLEVKEVDLEEKATQLSQKYFPDEENIWARPNIEAQRCKSACIEMVEWLKAQKGE